MKLQVVSNRKLYLQIADQIRDQVEAGAAKPGQQLPSERELALTLGVSRPTVREALIALEVAGMVEIKVGVGAFVRGPADAADLSTLNGQSPLETMAVRRLLEPEAAALAAGNMSEAGRGAIKAIVEQMRAETKKNIWSGASDSALHMTIASECGNLVLQSMIERLWNIRTEGLDQLFHQHLAELAEVRNHIMDDHERIVAAILKADGEGARRAMSDHLAFVASAMQSVWED